MGLLFVDLDDFKQVNDVYGHDAGDELIRQAADASERDRPRTAMTSPVSAATSSRSSSRMSTGDDQVRAAEQRVRAAFVEPFMLGDVAISIGASVGGGVWPDDGRTVTELVRHADAAMYQDKAELRRVGKLPSEPRLAATSKRRLGTPARL